MATIVEILEDFFVDEEDFKKESTYQDYRNKRTISCVLFEMVKDQDAVHHTGFTRDDTEQARKERIELERQKEKEDYIAHRRAKKKPVKEEKKKNDDEEETENDGN